MVTNVAYEMQTSKALIIGFDTPAIIQTSCEPLENLVATRAAQHSVQRIGRWAPRFELDSSESICPFRQLALPPNRRLRKPLGAFLQIVLGTDERIVPKLQ